MRRIGLSKRAAARSSSQSSKISLDDESQQPPITLSSSVPSSSIPALSSQPAVAPTSVAYELEQQFPRSAPSSILSSPPPPSSRPDALPLVASSELTEAESDDSIKWETNVTINVGHIPGLPQIEEEPVVVGAPEPSPSASSYLVSQSPQYANDAVANESAEVSEGHDEPDEPDDISTPSSSHSDNAASAPLPTAPAQNHTLRPISNRSVPIIPPSSSPHRAMISPSRHATNISPPAKRVIGSPSKRAAPSSPSKRSAKVTVPPHQSTRPEAHKRSASPDESSDFARGMSPVLRPFDYLNSITGTNAAGPSRRPAPTRPQGLASSQPVPGLEPTLLNETGQNGGSAPIVSSSPAAVHTSQTLLNTDPAMTSQAPGATALADGSLTQLNSVGLNVPDGSQTQLNSDDRATSPPRRFASLVSSRPRSSSPGGLFSESLDDIGASQRSNLHESFIATQVKALPTSPTSPLASAPVPGELEPTYVDSPGGNLVADPSPVNDAETTPVQPPRGIFPSSLEPPPLPPAPLFSEASSEPPMPTEQAQRSDSPSPSRPASQETLFKPPPPRFSPHKYGKRRRGTRIPSSRAAMPPEERRLSTEARQSPKEATEQEAEADDAGDTGDGAGVGDNAEDTRPEDDPHGSDRESSSAPDDPHDETFRDTPQDEPVTTPQAAPDPPAPKKKKTTSKAAKAAHTTRPARGKRKAMSPAPSFSDSSSSAPEDNEDYSYKPTKIGRAKAQATARAHRKAAREASRQMTTDSEEQAVRGGTDEPPKKRPRIAGPPKASSRASTRVPSVTDVDASGPLRVLALWSTTNEYYAGTIAGRNRQGFRVKFDDGYHRTLSLDRLRRLELRPGDPVLNGTKSAEVFHVAEAYDGHGDGVAVVNARGKASTIPLTRLVVLPNDVVARFHDRMIPPDVVEQRFTVPLRPFEGKVFIVSGKDASVTPEALRRRIETHGGALLDDWTALFSIGDGEYTLSARGAPFVLQAGDRCVLTPKIMSALAAGVPVLAARYVEDACARDVDWRSYLISPGQSAVLGQATSQVVDPGWGGTSWTAAAARAVRQPLAETNVLYVEPSGRFKRRAEMKVIVPFCLIALGAKVSRATTLPGDTARFDLVMVEDRDPGLPLTDAARASGKLVNVAWLKACLVAGAFLPPSIASDQ